MFETTKHIEMPLRRKRESRECGIHYVAGAVRAVHLVVEKECPSSLHRRADSYLASLPLVLEECIQRGDRGVE